ncbi:MAG: GNAT family N-acetyltransferase [Propionicimonas sp.]|uniref:GNAT family N-acetyltransferase n=1 Tax=Propionicimonas sp. TaxID=1955623 RepID=UPI002B1EBF38|nr:GNAT family N-acetyltransferase [Propionicimonas sp.]MEA4945414.1 GNAT family N-acetyltransferase [Propionicimonas sp.]MEA5116323.1 GNAT family N-acetyltransferase [Propionicimonas sp.]
MTITTSSRIALRPLIVPATLDDADASDFLAMVDVRNRILREVSGHDDHYLAPAAVLAFHQPNPYQESLWWVVEVDQKVVGRAGVDLPLETGSRIAFCQVELLREVQGRGIGSQAQQLVERTAREHGRTVLQSWVEHHDGPGEQLVPPTGFGSIPADDRAARFARKHGYALEQIERCSILDLSAGTGRLEALLAQATPASADYRLVSWQLPTPPEYVDGYAWMLSRMSTDAPAGGMEWDEEIWDAERLAVHDRQVLDGRRTMLVTAAQHRGTGDLCAFTELVIGTDTTRVTHQECTLVLKEHRGHSLGMLVKCANLIAWHRLMPDSPRVLTYNAEENRPMLDINEAMGFVPLSYEGAWKKVLAD